MGEVPHVKMYTIIQKKSTSKYNDNIEDRQEDSGDSNRKVSTDATNRQTDDWRHQQEGINRRYKQTDRWLTTQQEGINRRYKQTDRWLTTQQEGINRRYKQTDRWLTTQHTVPARTGDRETTQEDWTNNTWPITVEHNERTTTGKRKTNKICIYTRQ